MALSNKDDDLFSKTIKYTYTEISKIQGSAQYLASALGHFTVNQIYGVYREYPDAKAVIDIYLELHRKNYGWQKSQDDIKKPILRKEKICNQIKQPKFLATLNRDAAPNLDEVPETYSKGDRANFITMWYSVALMKYLPSIFAVSKLKQAQPKIKEYDAVHRVTLLLLHRKYIGSDTGRGKGFASRKTQANRYLIPPKCGLSSVWENRVTTNKIQETSTDVTLAEEEKALGRHYFRPLGAAQRA